MSRGLGRLSRGEADDRLVELVRDGDERAFEQIVRRYTRPLRSTCRRVGLSHSRAEDALQQTFLSAWLALRRGDDVRELGAWLRRIAHNKAVNIMRGPAEANAAADSELSGAERPALSHIEQRMALRQALSDIAALPPMQREALLMSAFEGRSYDEVARALGVSSGAVRGLLHRARASLRDAAAAVAALPLLRWLAWGRPPVAAQALGLAGATGADGGAGTGIARAIAAAAGTLALLAGVTVGPLHQLLSPAPHTHASSTRASSTRDRSRAQASGGAAAPPAPLLAAAPRPRGASAVHDVSAAHEGDRTSAGRSAQPHRSGPARREGRSRPTAPRSVYTPSEGNGEASVPAAVGTTASSSPAPETTPVSTPVESGPPTGSPPLPAETTPPKQKTEDPTDDPPGSEQEKEPAPGETRTPEEPKDR